MDRVTQLLSSATRSSRILEVGPSHAPIAPKKDGWNTTIIDYTDAANLRTKFGTLNVNTDAIEDVDCIWTNGPLHEAVPKEMHGTFDILIASHVIEHVPDLAQFFISAAVLLKPTGTLSLAVPDKRYTFDCFKPMTLTGDVLSAHRVRASRHSLRTAYSHIAYTAISTGNGILDTYAWGQHPVTDFKVVRGMDMVADTMAEYSDDPNSPYVDYHAWQVTPASFALIVLELGQLGVIDWKLEALPVTAGCEFIVAMKRGYETFDSDAALQTRRVELLRTTLMETREQTDWMLDDLPAVAAAPPPPAPEPVAASPAEAENRATLELISARLMAQEMQLADVTRVTSALRRAYRPVSWLRRTLRG